MKLLTSFFRVFNRQSLSPEPPVHVERSGGKYRVYTSEFEQVIAAEELPTFLDPLKPLQELELRTTWDELQFGLLGWKTKLLVKAAEASERIRRTIPQNERESTAVSLLLDQSGSMRGQKMVFAAASLDIAQEFLATLSVKVEVLGFTTSKWKGGRSRKRWNARLRPRNPGRLNDLLHIVYREAEDNRVSSGGHQFYQMLRPDLPKENVDGEAIEWAAGRLLERGEERKILVVLSDGAPVDDSTLLANGPAYLEGHLRSVIGQVEEEASLTIAAVGIGFSVERYYRTYAQAESPDELGNTLLNFLEQLLLQQRHSPFAKPSPGGNPQLK
jgi:cobaltochelatase CobT